MGLRVGSPLPSSVALGTRLGPFGTKLGVSGAKVKSFGAKIRGCGTEIGVSEPQLQGPTKCGSMRAALVGTEGIL